MLTPKVTDGLQQVTARVSDNGAQITAKIYLSTVEGGVTANDPRLTDAREWAADTIPQAEAEGGSATTRRAWTSQRVKQAFTSFFGAISSSLGRTLIGRATPALMRTDLGLGTAATGNIVGTTGTSTTDVMSQKAVTDELDAINLLIGDTSAALDAINGEVV